MSINKKLTIFIIIMIIVPMLIIFVASSITLNNQIKHSEQSYLENAHKIARNAMLNRKEEMKKSAQLLTAGSTFKQALYNKDKYEINKLLAGYRQNYSYVDYIIVVDKDKNLVSYNPTSLKYFEPWDINGLIEKARQQKEAITSEEIFLLDDYFIQDSNEYKEYRVQLVDNDGHKLNQYLQKCQTGLAVVPVYRDTSSIELLGFLVAGGISNNDPHFPDFYSKNVRGSFLAISVDGVRITSNIKTPRQGDYIGSSIPLAMDTLEGYKYYYFGRINLNGEVHVFLDEPILDSNGTVIGVLGVGIPDEKFSEILSTNNKMISVITVFCLVIMLVLGRILSKIITRPILVATQFAEKLSDGDLDSNIPKDYLQGGHSETTILLRTFQKMAQDLKQHEDERQEYLAQLEEQHAYQQQLLEQLKEMNDELETKVLARTQDLQQAIYALKKADAVKSQFLANMSHELRTPLSSIISCSEVLKDRIMGDINEKQEKYLLDILRNGTHLLQLINDILDISKIEAGKMKLKLSNFYISQVIDQSVDLVKSLAYRKNILITVNKEPSNFLIHADAKKLVQILYNLLSNAIKFTSDAGSVELTVYKRNEIMQISVRDNGIGIAEENQDRVFYEFEQVDSSYEREYDGTGLGLPLVRKLVEMHGGQVYLTSKIDVGTEVVFTIPIHAEDMFND